MKFLLTQLTQLQNISRLSLLIFLVLPLTQAFAFPADEEDEDKLDEKVSEIEAVQAFRYGKGFIEARIYGPAIVQLEQVLELIPEDADANYYMGLAYIGLKQPESAVPFLSQAIRSNDDYYAAYEQLGLVNLQMDQMDQARAFSERLGEKVAACADSCSEELNTANASLKAALEGKTTAVIDPASLLLNSKVDAGVVYRGAIAEINQGNYLAAIDLLMKTSAEAGPHPDVMTYLGFSYRKMQQYDQAIHYYRQALAIDSEHKGANEYLGELYVEIGDLARAGLQLQKLDELCPFSCAEKEELQRWISLID